MSSAMSQASLAVFEIGLNALAAVLDKAEAHASAKKIDPLVLTMAPRAGHVRARPSGADRLGPGEERLRPPRRRRAAALRGQRDHLRAAEGADRENDRLPEDAR